MIFVPISKKIGVGYQSCLHKKYHRGDVILTLNLRVTDLATFSRL